MQRAFLYLLQLVRFRVDVLLMPAGARKRRYRLRGMILSLEVGKWAGNIKDADLPDRLHVDYVRVYKQEN